MGSSTEYPKTITNRLITFRMKNMPRENSTISMPPKAPIPSPSILPKKEKKPNR